MKNQPRYFGTSLPGRALGGAVLVAAISPWFQGCAPTCTSAALSSSLDALGAPDPRGAAAAVANACAPPPDLAAWLASPDAPPPDAAWRAACPAAPPAPVAQDLPRIATREAAFQACDVAALEIASQPDFVSANGNPSLAVATTRWLLAQEGMDPAVARRVGQTILGKPAFTLPEVVAPIVDDATGTPAPPQVVATPTSVKVGDLTFNTAELVLARPSGPNGHGVALLADAAPASAFSIAADPALPFDAFRRVAASLATADGRFELYVLAGVQGRPHLPGAVAGRIGTPSISLRPHGSAWVVAKDGAALPALPGCPAPGPTACDSLPDPLGSALEFAKSQGPDVGLTAPAGATVAEWLKLSQRAASLGLNPAVDLRFEPCVAPPDGMICVPGGDVLVGTAAEGGPAFVSYSTFYLDKAEASVGSVRACEKAKACLGASPRGAAPEAPATGLSSNQARAYCAFQGKRLMSTWEYEAAARGPAATTLGLDRGPTEPTSTYSLKAGESCGTSCAGLDPLGACDAAPMCQGRTNRAQRGGLDLRKSVSAASVLADGGARCASDGPILDTFPSAWLQSPPPVPTAPPPAFTPEQRAILAAIVEDPIDEVPVCADGRRGSSGVNCKDSSHYIKSNEDRGHASFRWIQNRGGAYLGVGSDQNYTQAAVARSELVFLMDYDAMVVHLHRVNQAFVKAADTPADFLALWDPKNNAKAEATLLAEWKDDPIKDQYLRIYRSLGRTMFAHYTGQRNASKTAPTNWIRDDANYTWIRDLWRGGRIVALKGSMLGDHCMVGVGAALGKLGIPMRLYYTSNAPNAWGGHMTPEYRRNVRAFPMDESSVVMHTLGWRNEFGQTGYWHYNIQGGVDLQENLGKPGYALLWQTVRPYRPSDDVDVSLRAVPGTWEDSHKAQ